MKQKKQIKLTTTKAGREVILGTVDTTSFVKDGMLNGAKIDKRIGEINYLVLSFNTDFGKQDIRLDLSSIGKLYTLGNGITIDESNNNTISAKVNSNSSSYLTVTSEGVGVTDEFRNKFDNLNSRKMLVLIMLQH